jgi:hypothetical protein
MSTKRSVCAQLHLAASDFCRLKSHLNIKQPQSNSFAISLISRRTPFGCCWLAWPLQTLSLTQADQRAAVPLVLTNREIRLAWPCLSIVLNRRHPWQGRQARAYCSVNLMTTEIILYRAKCAKSEKELRQDDRAQSSKPTASNCCAN